MGGEVAGRGKVGFGAGSLAAGDGCGRSVSGVRVGEGRGGVSRSVSP